MDILVFMVRFLKRAAVLGRGSGWGRTLLSLIVIALRAKVFVFAGKGANAERDAQKKKANYAVRNSP